MSHAQCPRLLAVWRLFVSPTHSTVRRLLSAPVIALPLADSKAYVDRYGEPDKVQTGLGSSASAWPVPYWTIDTSMAVMTLLLAAEAVPAPISGATASIAATGTVAASIVVTAATMTSWPCIAQAVWRQRG